MAQKIIKISIPSDLFIALNKSENELKNDICIYTALQFYMMNKLTIGKASKLAGVSRLEFEELLSKNKISISNLGIKDIQEDIKKLEKI